MDSDPRLRRWYLSFNKKFFNGELPLDTILVWAPGGPAAAYTTSIDGADGKPVQFQITVDPPLVAYPRLTKLLLLHEMIHVKLWPLRLAAHGKRFKAELARLLAMPEVQKLV